MIYSARLVKYTTAQNILALGGKEKPTLPIADRYRSYLVALWANKRSCIRPALLIFHRKYANIISYHYITSIRISEYQRIRVVDGRIVEYHSTRMLVLVCFQKGHTCTRRGTLPKIT
jgi:hypothetical protein